MKKETLLIRQSDVLKVFDAQAAIEAVEEVFGIYGEGETQMPPKVYLHFPKGDLRCMPTYVPELGFASVKNVTVHPENKDYPTVLASITLIDPETGFPLAIMDGTLITRFRTAASAAIASKYLARKNTKTLGFVGMGIQARAQLEALYFIFPDVEQVFVYDRDHTKAVSIGQLWEDRYSIEIVIVNELKELLANSDVITTTTPSRKFFIEAKDMRPGTHINAIGADAKGKQELDPMLLKESKFVIDNWEQASHSGEMNVAVSEGLLKPEDVFADIGEVVTGKKAGRTSEEEITIFDSTGLAIQDLACAAKVYRAFEEKADLREQLTCIAF